VEKPLNLPKLAEAAPVVFDGFVEFEVLVVFESDDAVVFPQVASMLCKAALSFVVIVRLYVDLTLTHMLAYVQWYDAYRYQYNFARNGLIHSLNDGFQSSGPWSPFAWLTLSVTVFNCGLTRSLANACL
jgi:hypothetical protein